MLTRRFAFFLPTLMRVALLSSVCTCAFAVDLQEAWKSAQQHDPTLASARAMRDVAAENMSIAKARLLPQISLQSTQQQVEQRTQNSLGVSEFSGRASNTQFTLRQAIVRKRDRLGTEVAQLQAQIGQHRLDSANAQALYRTIDAWVDVLAAHAMRDLFASNISAAQSAAQQARQRLERGDGTRDTAAEAQAQLAQAQSLLADAEQSLLAYQRVFTLLTRLPALGFEAYRMAQASSLRLELPTLDQAMDAVLKSNPELLAIRLNEQLNERKLAQAGADHWPTLDAIGSITQAKNDSSNALGTRYTNHQIGLQFVLPIYSGGAIDAAQRQAAAQYASSTADTAAYEHKLRDLVSRHWHAIAGLRQRISSSEQLIGAAREQMRATELGMRNGTKTWADVATAEQLLIRRQADQFGLIGALLKSQIQILTLLPSEDPVTLEWARSLSRTVLAVKK